MPSYHTEQRVRVGELLHITSARMSSKPQLLCIWGRGLEAAASFCDSRTSQRNHRSKVRTSARRDAVAWGSFSPDLAVSQNPDGIIHNI